jgi:hypothetical protein
MNSETWWMCLNPSSVKAPMVRHSTLAMARAEAMRLAVAEGDKIHVLQVVGTAHPPTVKATWQDRGWWR